MTYERSLIKYINNDIYRKKMALDNILLLH